LLYPAPGGSPIFNRLSQPAAIQSGLVGSLSTLGKSRSIPTSGFFSACASLSPSTAAPAAAENLKICQLRIYLKSLSGIYSLILQKTKSAPFT